MKRKYEVRWYSYNLTQEKVRKFFTEIGAFICAAYLKKYEHTEPKIKEI